MTDAELVCLAAAQVLLRHDEERHWLRAAPRLVGHLFPRLLGQSAYNTRLKRAAPLMEAALRWLADHTPATAERLMDGTPVTCGQSAVTARRPDPFGYAGYGYCPSHSRWYRGSKLMLICTCEIVADKGFAGEDFEEFLAGPDLDLTLIRPARKDERNTRPVPNWLRQRVEAIIWTLKNQLGLERHGGRVPAGLWARIAQRLLALNAAIWHNWAIGEPVKRSLIAYDH